MEIKTTSNRMYAVIVLYDMHTKYYHSALAGISDADAFNRLGTPANHISWIAGSLVQERYELANLLGLEMQSTAHELFKDHKGIQEGADYPELAVYKADWDKVTGVLRAKLLEVSDEALNKVLEFPEMSFPLYDMITFDCYREANCIGQLALWRRLLGYPALNYM